ncbi:hypothetical protein [Rhizobium phaseoli]|uniref:hypothetical protein n=1 Tax=Rhizobium phaseoli TaxID=396 RepID=UPI0007F050A6|nr:hypothetical protein [Rhizobium phaseoli]ANL39254.1 hypothetical protein AMC88_CH00821 [Rhizobium phaseoli]ANL58243.1 hypothetical protein AMC85_CH00821 [Rhizobium phaseoli]
MSRLFFVLGVAYAILGMSVNQCLAQASLLAENTISSVPVKVTTPDGSLKEEVYTLVRDARVPDQWYYFPNEPRLAETMVGGKRVPELNFIKYTSKTSDGNLKGGGLLTFAVTLGASAEALSGMKVALAEELKKRGQSIDTAAVRLSAVPLNSASATVYTPAGDLAGEAQANSLANPPDRAAATNANGKIVFALTLSDVGSDIYNALLNGTSGIPVWVKFKFNGITPPAGFKVTVNWSQTQKHYSENKQFAARASYYGFYSASYKSDLTKVRDELINSNCIKVEATSDDTFTPERLDSYLQPILKRINDQILEDLKPPPKIDPARATSPGADGVFGGAGYSVAVKDISSVKTGSEVWDFTYSSILERAGAADGTVSLGTYPEDVRKSAVTAIDAGNWDRVFFPLPNIMGVDSATLRVRLKSKDKLIEENYFRYLPTTGWLSAQTNNPSSGVWISLLSRPDFDRTTASWDTAYQVALGKYTVNSEATATLSSETGVSSPMDLIRIIEASADGLPFETNVNGKELVSVDVRLTETTRPAASARSTFRLQRQRDGSRGLTPDLIWPIPGEVSRSPSQVEMSARYNYNGGRSCEISLGSAAFAQRFPSDVILLRLLEDSECK